MKIQYTVYACLVCLAIGSAVTYFYYPQVKTVEVTKDVVHTQVQTVTRTVKLPSGEVDTTTVQNETTNQTKTDNTSKIESKKYWQAGIEYGTDIHDLRPVYGGVVGYRVFGPVFLNANFNTTGYIGGSLTVEF